MKIFGLSKVKHAVRLLTSKYENFESADFNLSIKKNETSMAKQSENQVRKVE